MINQKKIIRLTKKSELKHLCWDQIYLISVTHIVLNGIIAITNPNNAKKTQKQNKQNKKNKSVASKNNLSVALQKSMTYKLTIQKIVLDVVMPMYNLLEYRKNYRKTTGSLWNYYTDEPSNTLSSNSESFKYMRSITRNTYNLVAFNANYDATKVGKYETEIVVPLKHLSNFWRTLNILLINCEIELILTWSKNCPLADVTVRAAGNNNDLAAFVAHNFK